MSSKAFWFLIMTAPFIGHTTSDPDWTKHCSVCTCMWVSGRKTANCSNQNLNQIPKNLSSVVREIDFSNNPLHSLSDGEFIGANLVDTHKLKFQNCSIDALNEGAFKRLALMIELDLSRNLISSLPTNVLRDNVKLRILILSYNRIETLEDGLFNNLTYLQRILVDHNEIEYISENTFNDLSSLTDMNLGYNKLKTIEFDLKSKLPKLNSLNVEENPWICDCRLEPFHQSILKNNLLTQATKCVAPPRMVGRLWSDRTKFPCSPIILDPLPSTEIIAVTENITLICKVSGDPEPDIVWSSNGHSVEKDTKKNRQKYLISKGKSEEYTWNNLTITNINYKDRGEYRCLAKNTGGEDEKNITLIIDSSIFGGGATSGMEGSAALIIGLSIGLVILLIIILILVCLFCKKDGKSAFHVKSKDFDNSSEEYINMSGHLEMKNVVMTDVNPICKPPRASVPGSIVSGGTEVSDTKRHLLDNDLDAFDADDESRSFDFDQPLIRKSHNTLLDPEYRHNNAPYPPDLLPFPPRIQISPTGSSASTVVADSRLPPFHGAKSPLHSPIYDQLSMYRTLPYSRSQSPFTQGMRVARVPKQGSGYITIPRRPRQSWSSEPPPSQELVGEPLYDNLGVRSSIGGSFKDVSEAARSRLPLNPSIIVPIVESHESPSSLTLPAEVSAYKPLEESQFIVPTEPPVPNMRPQTPQKPIGSQTLPRDLSKLTLTPARSQWVGSVTDSLSSEGKEKKIPPRPPPKPKKRESSGPLFEDEGEDGTEV